ncbi:MAG TPA: 2-oxo acid dehydrogenase subunit E2, partial [Candidatus Udaeobacter sp.]
VIFLVAKHLLWAEHEYAEPIRAVPLGKARTVREGSDITLVAWGNTIEKSLEALDNISNEISVELIDLRSIVPWDAAAIEESVRKTRRLIVVQEDTENCSVGQMIISHISGNAALWNELFSPPILVSKPNVVIGYNPIYEYAALPDVERIVTAIRHSISTKHGRTTVAASGHRARSAEESNFARRTPSAVAKATANTPAAAPAQTTEQHVQSITVPVMGEGIRNAKIVSLLKQPGEQIQLDDELCEVETDKAVYPIQSSFAGVMGEWKTKIGDTVEIGEELGTIATSEPAFAEQFEAAATESAKRATVETAVLAVSPDDSARRARHYNVEPALSPTITRKLNRVIPANLQIDARWNVIREARQAVKKTDPEQAPSPSVMIAWAVVRAMEKHAPFRRLVLEDDQIVQNDDFDLGIAVALEGDRLATAVITTANQKSWLHFIANYNETVAATRGGRVDAMNAPVVITSLGAFEVKAGAPLVVPPSVGTLFVGTAHRELLSNKNKNESAEVITLSLTFDHRVVNGAGAAAFANEIKKQIEAFKIPKLEKHAASL